MFQKIIATLFLGCVSYVSVAQIKVKEIYALQDGKRYNNSVQLQNGVVRLGDDHQEKYNVKPDVILDLAVSKPGLYLLTAETIPVNLESLKKNDTTGMLTRRAGFQLGTARYTSRIVFDSFKDGHQELGKFMFTARKAKLKIWLPANLIFCTITIKPYVAPLPPPEAVAYTPAVVPPQSHPRLWVNQESLPVVRNRLALAEHREAWEKVKQLALKPFPFKFDLKHEIFYDEGLEKAIEQKAFYYLMTNNRSIGKEAVDLAVNYLSVLEFGNITYGDITREIGRAIYTGSLVYDWCYNLLDSKSKASLRTNFRRLASDMEIGWPPFYGKESIINGHGNEAQICRDMLSWSLAVYNEDTEPYKYVSYTILKQLVPMRSFEYQSPRHNQGIDYGGYRFGWEMHAVWLYYRMLGYSVFDENIKNMPAYWLYMRTPDGKMLRDGDMFNVQYNASEGFYWKNPQTMLLCYAFSNNPFIKAEFYKQGGLPNNPVLFLLLNDPALKPDYRRDQFSLTKDFGPILSGMVARTGWDEQPRSANVVAEVKGGGYIFGNHQHADAGALQIYYHGMQVGDLGLYLSYGSPYDFNFNKRSVAHSMLLVRDPGEPLNFRTKTNDGGTRFSQRFPLTPTEAKTDPWFHTGYVRSSDFGPDSLKPLYSYYNANLTAAYTAKVKDYTKSFLFINTGKKDRPALIYLWDQVESADSTFKKYWQINTLNKPKIRQDGTLVLTSNLDGQAGNTYVNMLSPVPTKRRQVIEGGDSSTVVFGDTYHVNSSWPESRGYRIMLSPDSLKKKNSFLTVFQLCEENMEPLPVTYTEAKLYASLVIDDKLVVLSRPDQFLHEQITIQVPADKMYDVILAGLQPGYWTIVQQGMAERKVFVQKDKNTFHFISKGAKIVIKPQSLL
ncbi:heparin/heparan-sulfate lyase [bacterium A37T11]|nr:heparin/heparan-sulfate lyase [bacterium A37T11]